MLDSDERLAVRGDLEESGETGLQAVWDVLGLVVRRQAALWKDWRPWLACWTDWAGQRIAKCRLPMAWCRLRFISVDHSEPSRHRPNNPLANRLVGAPRHRSFGP
jgi:hypothetical protein